MKQVLTMMMLLPLAACAGGLGGNGGGGLDPDAVVEASGAVDANTAASEGLSGDGPAEGDGRFLGFSVASLGDASEGGFWVDTPLVDSEQPGRIVGENGQSVTVDLRPSGGDAGSGSRMSLQVFQALGISLTALPTVTVISDA